MALPPIDTKPKKQAYDVIIVGGAVMGSSSAWFLSANPDFNGSILVIEKDPTYEFSSTARTNSCIRQQFTNPLNVQISQFGVEFLRSFRERLGGDTEVPEIVLQEFGYMYLADNPASAAAMTENQKLQSGLGAATRLLSPDQLTNEYPFYNVEGILLGCHNPRDEGYFDGATMFDWWRRKARQNGVEYITAEVTAVTREGDRIASVTLASDETISAGKFVNATGPRAAATAQMAGLDIPVEPRRRYTFVFTAEKPLEKDLPLTIDPSGVHMRSDGKNYLCGCPPDDDPAVAFDDFEFDHSIWENKVWPALANRVPAFEAIKVINSWIGHYAFNVFDHNAIIGPHPEVRNFIFVNGFSGHGFQQSPAMGRGISELIAYGEYRELDMTELGYERIAKGKPFDEKAII